MQRRYPHRYPLRQLTRRLDRLCSELNAVLLALAVGLAVLDLTFWYAIQIADAVAKIERWQVSAGTRGVPPGGEEQGHGTVPCRS